MKAKRKKTTGMKPVDDMMEEDRRKMAVIVNKGRIYVTHQRRLQVFDCSEEELAFINQWKGLNFNKFRSRTGKHTTFEIDKQIQFRKLMGLVKPYLKGRILDELRKTE